MRNSGRPIQDADAGYRALMSTLVVALIQDLATLRRAGLWSEHPAEMAGLGKIGTKAWRELPTQVRLACQIGVWEDNYLGIMSTMAGDVCGVEVTPSSIIEAAKRTKSILRDRSQNANTGNSGIMSRARQATDDAASEFLRDRGLYVSSPWRDRPDGL
jgi:hypothetical protein